MADLQADADAASRLKSTCENCVRAKVKCSGQPGPCERCSGWRNLDCIFLEERKRGRPRLPEDEKKSYLNKLTKQISSSSLNSGDGEVVKERKPSPAPTGTGSRAAKSQVPPITAGTVSLPNIQSSRANQSEPAKLACVTSDCWTAIGDSNRHTTPGPSTSPASGLSPEQAHVVEIFFELYKNHASNRSCCRAWFARQLNKICGMLKAAQSLTALLSIVEWMNKHQILVSPMAPPEQKAFVDPDTGFSLPPMTSSKGPLLDDATLVDATTVQIATISPRPSLSVDSSIPTISLSYTRDERCMIKTNESFVNVFGRDAGYYATLLDTLYGGILPWGGDVFSGILYRPLDTVLLIRVLAFRFQNQPRMMDSTPISRSVQTSHIFPCKKADGTVIDCIARFYHVENISFQGVAVEVTATFEPYLAAAPAPTTTAPEVKIEPTLAIPETVSRGISYNGTESAQYDADDDFLMYSSTYGNGNGTHPIDGSKTGDFKDEWLEDLLKWVDDNPKTY